MLYGHKLIADVILWTLATPLAFIIRYDGAPPPASYPGLFLITVLALVVKLPVAYRFRLQYQSWRKISFHDLETLIRMIVVTTVPLTLLVLVLSPIVIGLPRSLPFLDGLLSLLLLAGLRASRRYIYERERRILTTSSLKRVMVVGAGDAGSLIAREMLRHPDTGLFPVGFVDDDPAKYKQCIGGVPVLGTLQDLPELLEHYEIKELLIAIPTADGQLVREIVATTQRASHKITYRIIPGMYEVLKGQVTINRIREVRVEDLLRRAPVTLDVAAIAGYLEGKRVIVTGAGGSIGSELVRQICRFKPAQLILLGRGENSIYTIERELDHDWPEIAYTSVIADVRDEARLNYLFDRYRPQVVFHAAAHKHVPLMEANPEEAIINNVLGTRNVVEVALRHEVTHLVNLSSDKAINPTSVMGASKRMAEFVVQHAALRATPEQHFASVRFGNVLGSRGSVIPLFKEQIAAGGPVTVTHPEMRRYFMTIPEASQLVLQAAGLGRNGEIYILDMGEPVKIVDVARDLIRLSGLEPDVDIALAFSGMRPGEKLFEELMTQEEQESSTTHEKIFIAKRPVFDSEALQSTLQALQMAALCADSQAIRSLLDTFIDGCKFEYERV